MNPQQGLQKQIELYRQLTPQQRLKIGFDLYELTRTLARQGVRYQHPDWEEGKVEQEVNRRFQLATGVR
jgi:hypothetical protein